jgi:hypothetical protein
MKIRSVKVNYGRTINMGNFESMRIDVEFAADIAENESPKEVAEQLRSMAKLEVNRMVTNKKLKDGLEDYY